MTRKLLIATQIVTSNELKSSSKYFFSIMIFNKSISLTIWCRVCAFEWTCIRQIYISFNLGKIIISSLRQIGLMLDGNTHKSMIHSLHRNEGETFCFIIVWRNTFCLFFFTGGHRQQKMSPRRCWYLPLGMFDFLLRASERERDNFLPQTLPKKSFVRGQRSPVKLLP